MKTLNDYVLLQYIDEESKSEGGLFIVNTQQTNLIHAKVISSNCQDIKEGDTVWVAKHLIQSSPNFMEGKQFFIDKKNIYGIDE